MTRRSEHSVLRLCRRCNSDRMARTCLLLSGSVTEGSFPHTHHRTALSHLLMQLAFWPSSHS
ncbi:hypothetical protein AMELA_G00286510 [Ameiurus melas]|uniref:Uncharacterized protein n=1 Tax=Ameiurus melas TaxID=219545 RepID=A0A7J5ZIP6_AMEME|nr:hypothetical protein AMELA_G00286510 [Ameiurus melas]